MLQSLRAVITRGLAGALAYEAVTYPTANNRCGVLNS